MTYAKSSNRKSDFFKIQQQRHERDVTQSGEKVFSAMMGLISWWQAEIIEKKNQR